MEKEIRLRKGKQWHFNVIYNNAKSKMSQTDDTKLSLKFTEKLVDLAKQWGYTKSYYTDRDALPGQNVFDELFTVIEGSDYTVVILTKDFLDNCWAKYCQMAAFKTLLETDNSYRVIGVLVGVDETFVPPNLSLNRYVSFTANDWKNHSDKSWSLLKQMMTDPTYTRKVNESYTLHYDRQSVTRPVQEQGDLPAENPRRSVLAHNEPSLSQYGPVASTRTDQLNIMHNTVFPDGPDSGLDDGVQPGFATNSSVISSQHNKAVEAGTGVVQTLPKFQQPSGTDDETHMKYNCYLKTEQREQGGQQAQYLPSGPALPCSSREQGCQQSTPQGASNTPAKQEVQLPDRPRETKTQCDTADTTIQGVSRAALSTAISTHGNTERSNAMDTTSSISQDTFQTETTEETLADNTLRTGQLHIQNKQSKHFSDKSNSPEGQMNLSNQRKEEEEAAVSCVDQLQSSLASEDLETDRGSLSLPLQQVSPGMHSGEPNLSEGSNEQVSCKGNVDSFSSKSCNASGNNNHGPQIDDAARNLVKDTDQTFEKGIGRQLHGKRILKPRTKGDNQQIGRCSQESGVNMLGNDELSYTQHPDSGIHLSREASLNPKSLEGDRLFQGEQGGLSEETSVKKVDSYNDNNRSPPDGSESDFHQTYDSSREANSTQPKSRLTSFFKSLIPSPTATKYLTYAFTKPDQTFTG